MLENDIVEFIKTNFSNNREKLIPLIESFQWNDSPLREICNRFFNELKRPINARLDLSTDKKEQLADGTWDKELLGDICDYYTILLNPEIAEVDDWDFENLIKQDQEVHYCRIWINWFLPVYYLEVNYDKGSSNGKFLQFGPLTSLTEFETKIIQQITSILSTYNYYPCQLPFLSQTLPGLSTDIINQEVKLFECLFSDSHYYYDEHIKKSNDITRDFYEKNLTIEIIEFLNDNFELERRERTLYYNLFGYVTIVTNANNEVKEVICRGFIDGIPGNEKIVKIGV